jgi:hypothetical protein
MTLLLLNIFFSFLELKGRISGLMFGKAKAAKKLSLEEQLIIEKAATKAAQDQVQMQQTEFNA